MTSVKILSDQLYEEAVRMGCELDNKIRAMEKELDYLKGNLTETLKVKSEGSEIDDLNKWILWYSAKLEAYKDVKTSVLEECENDES